MALTVVDSDTLWPTHQLAHFPRFLVFRWNAGVWLWWDFHSSSNPYDRVLSRLHLAHGVIPPTLGPQPGSRPLVADYTLLRFVSVPIVAQCSLKTNTISPGTRGRTFVIVSIQLSPLSETGPCYTLDLNFTQTHNLFCWITFGENLDFVVTKWCKYSLWRIASLPKKNCTLLGIVFTPIFMHC